MNHLYCKQSGTLWSQLAMLLICLAFTPQVQAQVVMVQVGTGTTTHANIPITTRYGYSYSQQIYTASDLNAAGAIPGASIQKIRFYLESGATVANSSDWTIYMGNATRTQFNTNADWEPLSNLTQVFSGTVSFPAAGNWMELTLASPFAWNGTGSIVIAVDENTPNFSSANNFWRTTATAQNRSIFYRSDGTNPDPASPPSSTGVINAVNNIQFDFLQIPCSGAPAPGATVASAPALCGSGSSQLTLQNSYTSFSGINYQWQSSPNGSGSWQNINGATTYTYTANPGATTWYRAVLSCGINTGNSGAAAITVHTLPDVTINNTHVVYCAGAQAALTASGANSYSWTPVTELSAATGATVQATPAAPRLYTVTGTDNNSCQDTASVLVSPIASYIPASTVSPATSCSPGTAVTVTISNPPSAGGLEYLLSDTAGNVIAPWQSGTGFTFTPSSVGNLKYLLLARNPVCNQVSDTGTVHIYYGFSAAVQASFDCAGSNNRLIISNPQGADFSSDSWQQNFDLTTLPAGITLHGAASVTNGRAAITPSATSQKGGMSIAGFGATDPGTVALNFLLTADLPINIFGTGGADGIAWSFGDDANYGAAVTNGAGSKLRLVFDAASNGSENGNTIGIYLTYGYSSNTQMGPASTGVLAYSSNMSWKVQTDKPVSIIIDRNSQLTMTYDGNIIFDHIQLPPAYSAADKSQWKHLFTAFTGGDALRFAVDDLSIRYTRQEFVYGISAGGTGQLPASWQVSGTFAGFNAPDSFDVWIASANAPASCNKLLGTYRFRYPVAITNLSHTDLSACDANDGSITLEGLVPNITYNLAYTKNSSQNIATTAVANNLGHVVISNLTPGSYSAITLTLDSCSSTAAGPVIIPETIKPAISAAASGINNACTVPTGAITLSSPGFASGASYEVWYDGAARGSFPADANQQIVIPGLSGGNYNQVYVVTPQSCHSDTVTTVAVAGFLPPPVITGLNILTTPGCTGTNGTVRLSGIFNPATTTVIFRRNGIWGTTSVAQQNTLGLMLEGLLPGVYDSIQVLGDCPSNYWNNLTLSGAPNPPSISSANATKTDIQGATVAVEYTNNSCELIARIASADSLGNTTVMVGVLGQTMIYNNQPYLGRYYDISAGNNAGGTVTIYFRDAEINHYNTTVATMANNLFPPIGPAGENLQITAYHAAGSGAGPQGYNTTGAEVITPSAIVHNTISGFWAVTFHTTSFSGFFAHTNLNGSPLPVRLGAVAAVNLGAVNRVDWHTTQESEGDRFLIERSADGREFTAIGTRAAQGKAGSAYHFTDMTPVEGLNFYRIRIEDNDGSSFYSKVVSARADKGQLTITTVPNPVEDELSVLLAGSNEGGTLLLADITGRLIDRRTVKGDGQILFSMRHLAPGVYMLTYRQGAITRTAKVIRR